MTPMTETNNLNVPEEENTPIEEKHPKKVHLFSHPFSFIRRHMIILLKGIVLIGILLLVVNIRVGWMIQSSTDILHAHQAEIGSLQARIEILEKHMGSQKSVSDEKIDDVKWLHVIQEEVQKHIHFLKKSDVPVSSTAPTQGEQAEILNAEFVEQKIQKSEPESHKKELQKMMLIEGILLCDFLRRPLLRDAERKTMLQLLTHTALYLFEYAPEIVTLCQNIEEDLKTKNPNPSTTINEVQHPVSTSLEKESKNFLPKFLSFLSPYVQIHHTHTEEYKKDPSSLALETLMQKFITLAKEILHD